MTSSIEDEETAALVKKRIYNESLVTAGCGYQKGKQKLLKIYWDFVWPKLVDAGWTKVDGTGSSIGSVYFVPSGVDISRSKKGKEYYDRIRAVLDRILERRNDVETNIARMYLKKMGFSEHAKSDKESKTAVPGHLRGTSSRGRKRKLINDTGSSDDESESNFLPARLDLSWKTAGRSFPRMSSRIGQQYQVDELPDVRSFAWEEKNSVEERESSTKKDIDQNVIKDNSKAVDTVKPPMPHEGESQSNNDECKKPTNLMEADSLGQRQHGEDPIQTATAQPQASSGQDKDKNLDDPKENIPETTTPLTTQEGEPKQENGQTPETLKSLSSDPSTSTKVSDCDIQAQSNGDQKMDISKEGSDEQLQLPVEAEAKTKCAEELNSQEEQQQQPSAVALPQQMQAQQPQTPATGSQQQTPVQIPKKEGSERTESKMSRTVTNDQEMSLDSLKEDCLATHFIPKGREDEEIGEKEILYDQIWDPIQADRKGVLNFVHSVVPSNKKEAGFVSLHKREYCTNGILDELTKSKPMDGSDWTKEEKEQFKKEMFKCRKDFSKVSKAMNKSICNCLCYYLGTYKHSDDYRLMKTVCQEERHEKHLASEAGLDACAICGDGGNLLICDGCEGEFHIACLDPPLESIPEGDWECDVCINQKFLDATNFLLRNTRLYEQSGGNNTIVTSPGNSKKRKVDAEEKLSENDKSSAADETPSRSGVTGSLRRSISSASLTGASSSISFGRDLKPTASTLEAVRKLVNTINKAFSATMTDKKDEGTKEDNLNIVMN